MNTTFFVGAGASFGSLPLVNSMRERMEVYCSFLKYLKQKGKLKHQFAGTFINELDELIEVTENRTSIDAHAKMLSISNQPNAKIKLLRLKALLSSYLLFEQLIKPKELVLYSQKLDFSSVPHSNIPYSESIQKNIKTSIDKRYFTFWTECLEGDIPKASIKIISWNYDMQFEASYSYIKNYSLELTQNNLQVYPSTINKIDISRFCILKLNGTAGLVGETGNRSLINSFDIMKHGLMDNIDYLIDMLNYNYDRSSNKPLFSFAWENNILINETRQLAQSIIKETKELVIVGYSFPDYNYEIDQMIFSEAKAIEKVYLQVIESEIDETIERIESVCPNLKGLIIPKPKLDKFYKPPKL